MPSLRAWTMGVALFVAIPAFAQEPLSLSGVVVNPAQRTIVISGTGFDPEDTTVSVGTGLDALQPLQVLSVTPASVSVRWPPQRAGVYVVGVSSVMRHALASYTVTAADVAAAGSLAGPPVPASQFVQQGLELIADYALPLLIAFAGVGLVTMALIQAAKDVMPIRRRFHKTRIDKWLRDRGGLGQRETLIALAAAGNETALFELPVAGMMGQLTMASRIVLAFPKQFEPLLRLMAGKECTDDINIILEGSGAPAASTSGGRVTTDDDIERARVRVGHMVERNIDAMQISIASIWERGNKICAFVVSTGVTAACFIIYFWTTEQSPESAVRVGALGVATSILAGVVAPVAKDLVTALQNLKKS